MQKSKKKIILLELCILVSLAFIFGTAWGSPFVGDINFIDEGQFGAWANHMLHGKMMYKDIFMVYGPLYVYPLYVLFKFFEPSAFLVRAYLTVSSIIGLIAVYFVVRELYFHAILRWLVIIFFIVLPVILLRHAFCWLTIYAIILFEKKNRLIWIFVAGIFSVLSFLVSSEMGVIALIILIAYFITRLVFTERIMSVTKAILVCVAGLAMSLLIFTAWSYKEGWLFEYISVTESVLASFSGIDVPNGMNFPFPFPHILTQSTAVGVVKILLGKEMMYYWALGLVVSSVLYIFIRSILFKKSSGIVFPMIVLFSVLLYPLLISRPGIAHFFFILGPIIIITFTFIQKLVSILLKENSKSSRLFSSVFIIFLSVFLIRLLMVNRPQIFKSIQAPVTIFRMDNNPSRVGQIEVSQKQKQQIILLQSFFKSNSSISDKVFFLTDEPMYYLLIDRMNPTSYDLPFAANLLDRRLYLLSELQKNRPRYIVEDKSGWDVDGIANRQRLPEVSLFIDKTYRTNTILEKIIIYEIKDNR